MNKLLLGLFSTLLAGVFYTHSHASEKLSLPRPEKFSLKNSVKVITIKDELPVTVISVSFGYGQLYENSSNAGIGDCLASMLSLSGSKNYPLGKLAETVETMGGSINISSSWDRFTFTLKVLDRFSEEAFKIIGDLITNPNFDTSSWETVLKLNSESVKRRYDSVTDTAFIRIREKIFLGEGYGATPDSQKILNYKIEDAKAIWNKYFNSGNMLIGISSARDASELKTLSEKYFTSVKKGERQVYSVNRDLIIENINQHRDTVFFYERNIPQAVVTIGTIGQSIDYAGDLDLGMMNHILGGGSFTSRLVTEIRVKRGLAYAVQSVYRSRAYTGVFLAFTQIPPHAVIEVLEIFEDNCKAMTKEKVSDDELSWSKSSIRNSDVFKFDTPLSILSQYLSLEYNNLPPNYFEDYLQRIDAINADSIKDHSSDLFQHGLIKLVVGPASVKEELQKKYRVEVVD